MYKVWGMCRRTRMHMEFYSVDMNLSWLETKISIQNVISEIRKTGWNFYSISALSLATRKFFSIMFIFYYFTDLVVQNEKTHLLAKLSLCTNVPNYICYTFLQLVIVHIRLKFESYFFIFLLNFSCRVFQV